MINTMIKKSINSFGSKYNYDVSYMIGLADTSTSLIMKFSNIIKLNNYRKAVPLAEFHIARITSIKTEDCGPCVQLNIDFALEAGLDREIIKTALNNPNELPRNLALIHNFTLATIYDSEDLDKLRQEVLKKYGEKVVAELSVCIALCRVYPTIKRGMGHSKSCSLVSFNYGK